MKNLVQKFSENYLVQFFVFFFINGICIYRYIPRIGVNPVIASAVYIVFILCLFFTYKKIINKLSDTIIKVLFYTIVSVVIASIAFILIKVDPYSVNVDRWSAVSFFLDHLFQGQYPYSVSTHMSETNFPSPFPVWHLIYLPFYLAGDVGIGLIFFLVFFLYLFQLRFQSYKKSLLFIILLICSPTYWWEVFVRSDTLNNIFLVGGLILWFSHKKYSLENKFWLTVILCGLITSTRLLAILPLALFFFKPYTELSLKKKIIFPLGVLFVAFITFCPFIFWDTENWIFFSRNPLITQGLMGNIYILTVLVILGIFLSLQWKDIIQFNAVTSLFLLVFFLSFNTYLVITSDTYFSLQETRIYDISYFYLSMPFCLIAIIDKLKLENDSKTSYS